MIATDPAAPVAVIVGVDRFMSEARALTNFSGNAVGTLLIGTWTRTIDASRANRVLRGEIPFELDAAASASAEPAPNVTPAVK